MAAKKTQKPKHSEAEKLCAGVDEKIRSQAVTLANAVLAMQVKIEKQIPDYQKQPMAQLLTTTQGEQALKNNPVLQEFRATVRDYAAALNNLQDILDENKVPTQISEMSELRKKFNVAK